jgi:hypothetical protein
MGIRLLLAHAQCFPTYQLASSLFRQHHASAVANTYKTSIALRTQWKFAANINLLKLQNKVLRTTGRFPRHTKTRDSRVAFKMLHVYDINTKSCRQQSEVLENGNFMFSSLSMVNLQNQHNSISLRLKNTTF